MKKLIFALFITTGLIMVSFFIVPEKIIIKEIRCTNQFGNCNKQIVEKLKHLENNSLKLSKLMVRDVLSSDFLVHDFAIKFIPPRVLEISIIESVPRYALKNTNTTAVSLVDERGVAISISENSKLPMIFVEDKLPNVGDRVDDKTFFAINIVDGIRSMYEIEESNIFSDRLNVILKNNPKIIFPLSGDRDLLLGSASVILSRLKQTGEDSKIEELDKISEIDLRFSNPVLR